MEIIKAVCIALPSGETLWIESDKGMEYVKKAIAAWKKQNPEYRSDDYSMGLIEIRMPADKFNAIPATNTFTWPEVNND